MNIEHFGGSIELKAAFQLDEILDARYGDDANEFFIYGVDRYPLLSIQVHGSSACLHFFPKEEHPGFLSMGEQGAPGVSTQFTNTPRETIEVPNEALLPFSKAREAANEFWSSGSMPTCIQWLELRD